MSKGKVIVALSGGVDSAVSAALLREEGYEVEGVFMKNWSPTSAQSLTDCPWEVDQADAEAVCRHLGIPFRSLNFEKEYREKVVDYLVQEYAAGRTPNPDVMCNKEIKFAAFWKAAHELGAEWIATGHYAQTRDGVLYRGADARKDQSYFLYSLDREQLRNVLFPVGGMQKAEVRQRAADFGLPNQNKKDSQGICFIGHLDLKDFLREEIGQKPGLLYLLPGYESGTTLVERERYAKEVGRHLGVAYHTIGEKMGKYIDNRYYRVIRDTTQIPTTFVVSKNHEENFIYITDRVDDPHLYTSKLTIEHPVVTGGDPKELLVDVCKEKELTCQIRYQQVPTSVTRVAKEGERVILELAEPVWGAAVGQSVVLYTQDRVLGGGILCATS